MKFGRKREIVKSKNVLMKRKENPKAFPIIERVALDILAKEFAKGKERELAKAFANYEKEVKKNIEVSRFPNGQKTEKSRKRTREEIIELERALGKLGMILGSKERAKEFLREYTKTKWEIIKYRNKLLSRQK
jgi:hypothetical protein